jgi:hypothetical protein
MPSRELGELNKGEDSGIQRKRIWEYEPVGLDQVRNVTVRHRMMGDMRMPVLERVQWGEVSIGWGGNRFTLPLQSDFVLANQFLREGQVPDSETGMWVLPMSLQSSFQRVFGYELAPDSPRPRPLSNPGLDNLMQPCTAVSGGTFQTVRTNGRGNETVPLRVLVVLGLGCAGERKDFEPGGVLGAAKIIPHFMVMANYALRDITATITQARPARTAHTTMDGERMEAEFHAGLWTDSNDNRYGPPEMPYWQAIFDYFWVDPQTRLPMQMVKRSAPRREISGMLQVLHDDVVAGPGGSGYAGSTYRPRTVVKLERQGEFDNLHIAPRMLLPTALASKYPRSWPIQSVAMAPFCVHDCLHTHWRWGNPYFPLFFGSGANKWVKGWSRGVGSRLGQPYRETGAPMVPHNQDVTVELLTPSSFRYTAQAQAPAAGDWQVIMHHGSGYAMSWTNMADLAKNTVNILSGSDSVSSWTLFYLALRYDRVPVQAYVRDPDPSTTDAEARRLGYKFVERLKFDRRALDVLRTR